MKINVDNIISKNRIDIYIAQEIPDLSRMMIKKLILEGNILVNGKNVKTSYNIKKGDIIDINIPKVKEVLLEAEDIPLEVVYEDNDIIVVNKPKGMVVHPGHGNPNKT